MKRQPLIKLLYKYLLMLYSIYRCTSVEELQDAVCRLQIAGRLVEDD
jgi:hypothetical protein